ncbi:acyltransferase [Sphingomonas sp.]|uniref:acyltransferase family protein n=1 Tax=Sphingomonas sp. TaxID=28214 RepID=UPI000DB31C15|nr:acyltransferase [Sphingomonas sp.]PZU11737.1 MAG: acyltransferase [Sphingomonas sp.]
MDIGQPPKRFGDHHNAFGFLRLLLASLVIISHTADLVDGDRRREILVMLFGSLSFGELAVDGFFIISGFLISASFLNSSSALSYLRKRIARIYPAFALMSVICVFVVAPLGGGQPARHPILSTLANIVILSPPGARGVFAGSHHADLNGAAWTLQIEFYCYLLVVILGRSGLLRAPRLIGALAFGCILLTAILPDAIIPAAARLPLHSYFLPGDPRDLPRLFGMFLTGTAFYLLREHISLTGRNAILAFCALCLSLFFPVLANFGVALFGSYVLFAVAALGSGTVLAHVNNRDDISYGLYLYGWPIEKLLILWRFSDNLFVLAGVTWLLAALAGAISWFALEKPVMRWIRSKPAARATTSVAG